MPFRYPLYPFCSQSGEELFCIPSLDDVVLGIGTPNQQLSIAIAFLDRANLLDVQNDPASFVSQVDKSGHSRS